MTSRAPAVALDVDVIDFQAFADDINALRAEIDASLGPDDLRHLRRVERWGRLATVVGLATAPIVPNPLSAAALALGRSTRWLLMHHVGHRGYDKVPDVPKTYTARVFARGRRRFVDWADWMTPEAWIYEHNILHHQHTGEQRDPDLIERNLESVHRSGLPIWLRYGLLGALAATWRASYYAPKTLSAWHHRRAARDVEHPLPLGLLLRRCWTPYALLTFVALPLLYAPLGAWAVFSAWCNSVMADVITNLHTFFVVGPNHTGDDLFRFDDRPGSRGEFFVRQVMASANYRTGGDLTDFAHLWLNYQIEHHLFPDVPMLAYRRIRPKVQAVCERHGVPYVQEPVTRRFAKMARVFVGTARMRRLERPAQITRAVAH